ncbi:unnamed protein product, partial [Polarella glacialis]
AMYEHDGRAFEKQRGPFTDHVERGLAYPGSPRPFEFEPRIQPSPGQAKTVPAFTPSAPKASPLPQRRCDSGPPLAGAQPSSRARRPQSARAPPAARPAPAVARISAPALAAPAPSAMPAVGASCN